MTSVKHVMQTEDLALNESNLLLFFLWNNIIQKCVGLLLDYIFEDVYTSISSVSLAVLSSLHMSWQHDWRITSAPHQVSRVEVDLLVKGRAAPSPTLSTGTLTPHLQHFSGVQIPSISSLDVKTMGETMRIWRWMETTPLAPSQALTWTVSPGMDMSGPGASSAGSRTRPSSTNWGSLWRRSFTAAPRGWKSLVKGWTQMGGPCATRTRSSVLRSSGAGKRAPRSPSRGRETSHRAPFLPTLFSSSRTSHTPTFVGRAQTLSIPCVWACDRWVVSYFCALFDCSFNYRLWWMD